MPTVIKRSTKKNIFDHFNMAEINFSGRMNDKEFLERLYDLTKLPSNDSRYENAASDVWQHTVNNYDLQGNWVFDDNRFELLSGPDDVFLKFVCEMVHPLVRTDKDVANRIVVIANDWLREDGWELYPAKEIAGGKIYLFRPINPVQKHDGSVVALDSALPSDLERIWDKGQYRLFLSHSSTDKASVAKVKSGLAQFKISTFVAHDDIEPTAHWQVEIEKALHSMDALAAFVTEDFNNSVWCQQEIGFAFGRKVPVIPVKIARPPAGFLGKIQAITSRWESADIDIMKCLLKIPSFTDVFIEAASQCESWTQGNRFAKLLGDIQHLNLSQAQRLATAYYENGELRQSFGFNGTEPGRFGHGLKYHLQQKGFEMIKTDKGYRVTG